MAAASGLETECKSVVELLNSLQQQADKFFMGRQTTSNPTHSREEAQAELDELSKLADALHEKLVASGLHALPLDSETSQLDCQATIKKDQEDVDTCRGTAQRLQTNCLTLNKVIGQVPKK